MQSNTDIHNLFLGQCETLDRDLILKINENWKSPELVNVIRGFNKHCYGISLIDIDTLMYQLYYFNGTNELEGFLLNVRFSDLKKEKLIFYFSDFLSSRYKHLDTIDTFNTFQYYTRSLLENLGYLTASTTEIQQLIDKTGDSKFVSIEIYLVMTIDKVQYLKKYFECLNVNTPLEENETFIYLMLNRRNNYIKIGRSKDPLFREKTLQAQEPDIHVVASWRAHVSLESELHTLFKNKRIRGEWFDLRFSDLKVIKQKLKKMS